MSAVSPTRNMVSSVTFTTSGLLKSCTGASFPRANLDGTTAVAVVAAAALPDACRAFSRRSSSVSCLGGSYGLAAAPVRASMRPAVINVVATSMLRAFTAGRGVRVATSMPWALYAARGFVSAPLAFESPSPMLASPPASPSWSLRALNRRERRWRFGFLPSDVCSTPFALVPPRS